MKMEQDENPDEHIRALYDNGPEVLAEYLGSAPDDEIELIDKCYQDWRTRATNIKNGRYKHVAETVRPICSPDINFLTELSPAFLVRILRWWHGIEKSVSNEIIKYEDEEYAGMLDLLKGDKEMYENILHYRSFLGSREHYVRRILYYLDESIFSLRQTLQREVK